MQNEEWRIIEGFESYKISSYGNVIGSRKSSPLKLQCVPNKKYFRAQLKLGDRYHKKQVHRLVYEAFVGKIPDGMEIDHKDENPKNNHISNLRCVTHVQNQFNRSITKKNKHIRVWYSGYSYGYRATVNGQRITKFGFSNADEAHFECEEARKRLAVAHEIELVDN